jgi:hypothetical protein
MEPQKMQIEFDLFNLSRDCMELVNDISKKKNIELVLNIGRNTMVFADNFMLAKTIIFFSINIIKYSNRKSIIKYEAIENSKIIEFYINCNDMSISKEEFLKILPIVIINPTDRIVDENKVYSYKDYYYEYIQEIQKNMLFDHNWDNGNIVKLNLSKSGQAGNKIDIDNVSNQNTFNLQFL